ncbi:MAG: alpha/beta fold hydrolase [Porphyrobacter sp.]|nr:alpha/beta fold hydrolase [Porphyrobacter sp.]
MTYDSISLEFLKLPAEGPRRGPPLLFVHGGFHGAWCWHDHFMPWFAARGFDCHAVSLRDHGNSTRTGKHREWRLSDYVDDVRRTINQLDEKPILVGHSLGGSIIQKLAATEPFPAMILLAPSPVGGSNRAALRMIRSHPRAMLKAFGKGDLTAALPAFLTFFLSNDLPDDRRERIAARLDGLSSLKAANEAFYFNPPKPRPLGFPVLVVSGANDWSIPRYKNEKLAGGYRCDHIVVPTAHDIMCDTRWEAAADSIFTWMVANVGTRKWDP